MWHKVKWLTFWVSMTLWFGNVWGCASRVEDQNYKASQPDRPSTFDRFDSQGTVPVGDANASYVFVNDEAAPAAATPATAAAAPHAAPAIAPAVALDQQPMPMLAGLDRSHWPKIKTGVAIGRTRHLPAYFNDYPPDRAEPAIRFDDPQATQLEAAMAGNEDHGLFDGHHALQLISQPVKTALDIILLPYRMFVAPPWSAAYTP